MKAILVNESTRTDYLKWKRANVSLRGISETGGINGNNSDILGKGLYTAHLSNKSMAKGYGKTYFVFGAKPKHPKTFKYLNDWEIFEQGLIINYLKSVGIDNYDTRKFNAQTSITDEMLKLGYDGVEIKGREMVNYTPDNDNIKYFETEHQLERYYDWLNS